MPVFNNILAGASGATSGAAAGYQIDRSLRFNSGDSAYLNFTPSTSGNKKKWTWSGWVKKCANKGAGALFGAISGGNYMLLQFRSDNDRISIDQYNTGNFYVYTDAIFRDNSAWYHIVCAVDTTQATESNRIKIWVNGVQQTLTAGTNWPTQNQDTYINDTSYGMQIGTISSVKLDGYLAETHLLDGTAVSDASDFGEYDDNGVWQPKKFGGSYFTSVSTATGALPIHNTSGTFGGTKVTGNRTDPNASNLVLAISGSGSYQDISATIKGSGTNKTVTANGNVTTSSSEGKYYGGGSLELTGSSGDYFSIPNSSDFAFGTGDFTVEFWIKTTDTAFNILDITAGGGWSTVLVNTGAQLFWQTSRASTNLFNITTNSDLIDGAWHHVAFVRSSNVVKPYLDGVQIGNSAGYTDNTDYDVTTGSLNIGSGANGVLDGYMQDIRIYKGVAKYTSNFTVSAPSNSFHLDFSDNTSTTTIAEDSSGSDNDWTANNFSVASGAGNDSLIDTPTNYTAASGNNGGNYCTFNPLDSSSTSTTTSNGNLDVNITNNSSIRGSFYVSSGKWYYEVTVNTLNNLYLGLAGNGGQPASYSTSDAFGVNNAGDIYKNGSNTGINSVALAASSTFGIAFDADNQLFWLAKDGQWYSADSASTSPINVSEVVAGTSGYDFSSLSGDEYAPHFGNSDTAGAEISVNFGQRPFAYTPPTGHVSLCTTNLPDPTIADGSTAMDVVTYSGDGTNGRDITVNHSTDFVWIKSRNQNDNHILADSVRGTDKILFSQLTIAEATDSSVANSVTAFNSDGFTVGNNASSAQVNQSGFTYAAWSWDAGDSNTSISVGSLNSSFYNQSQTWSSNITTTGNNGTFHSSYPATNAFNNNDSNYAHGNGDGSQTAVVTLTLSPGVSCINTVTFLGGMTGSGTATISVNGGTAVNLTSGSSATTKTNVSFSGTVTSIVITKTSSDASGMLIYGFEIDGIRLVDNGVSVTNVPSIASTVRANPTAGISVLTWTAAAPGTSTIGHGLSDVPAFVISKSTSTSNHWAIFHKSIGQSKLLRFNSGAMLNVSNYWGSSSNWTSSTFCVNATTNADNNIGNMVAYCFAEVSGFSKFGEYDATQPFVYLGFKPRFLLLKDIDAAEDWCLYDSEREPVNPNDARLEPNTSDAEVSASSIEIDFLSNGFKIKGAGSTINGHVIYAAFASNPFKFARAA